MEASGKSMSSLAQSERKVEFGWREGASSVLNSTIASTIHSNIKRAINMNNVLHEILKRKLVEIMNDIRSNMVSRFSIVLPYNEIQNMLMTESAVHLLHDAGTLMPKQNTHYNYKLGETITIMLNCRGGKEMPSILFGSSEITNFSEEFLDIIRPLYLITKSWQDVLLAFDAVCKIVQDTRELNFYVPWLKYIIPENDLTNKFNGQFRITQWLNLDQERRGTIDLISKQIQYILNNEYTSKRTWMPSELVYMVRGGEELITQYNIMKTIAAPLTIIKEDMTSVDIDINFKNHPTIKWISEAVTHRTMKEGERLAEIDRKRAQKIKKGEW